MKAIIAEVRGEQAAVLLEDGRFIRVRNRGYAVGQRVTLTPQATLAPQTSQALHERQKPQAARKRAPFWISVASAFLLIAGVGGTAGYTYYTPYAYVSIDVNPSVELTLNRFLRVLSVNAVNDAGAEIVDDLDLNSLQYASVETAVETTVSRIMESDYVAPDSANYVVIAANAGNVERSEALAQTATQVAQAAQGSDGGELTIVSFTVSEDEVEEAHAQDVTPGKMRIVQTLEEAADEGETPVDREYWLQQPVKDILNERDHKARPDESGAPEDSAQPPDAEPVDTQALPSQNTGTPPQAPADQPAQQQSEPAETRAPSMAFATQDAPQQTQEAAASRPSATMPGQQADAEPISADSPNVAQETPPPFPRETELPQGGQTLPEDPSAQATPAEAQPSPSPSPTHVPPGLPQQEANDLQDPTQTRPPIGVGNPGERQSAPAGFPPPNK